MKNIRYNKSLVRPFIYTAPSITSTTIAMMCLLSVQIIMLVLTKSYTALIVILSSCVGTTSATYIAKLYYKNQKIFFLPSVLQGILLGMLLPENYPFVTVFFVAFLAILVSKILSKNLPYEWHNFVALAVIICWIVGMQEFPISPITADIASLPNPSLAFIQSGNMQIVKYDSAITDFLNRNFFSLFNISLPDGYISLLWDNHSAIPAFRFNIITLLSSIVLIAIDMISFFVPLVFFVTYSILIRIFMPIFFGSMIGQGDIILSFTTGGTIFCAVYLLQWFGTTPSTVIGKIVYAFFAGVVAFFVVGYGMSSVGMVFTIFVSNIFSTIIQMIEEIINSFRTKQMILENIENGVSK